GRLHPRWCNLHVPRTSGVVGESPGKHLDPRCRNGWPGSVDRRFHHHGGAETRSDLRAGTVNMTRLCVTGVLKNPVLKLMSGTTTLVENDNWQSASNSAQIISTGIPPTDSNESAVLVRLEPGAYTTVVSGANGTTGIALVEVYEIDRD